MPAHLPAAEELMVEETSSSRKRGIAFDGTLETWPSPPPRVPKSALEKTRLTLIEHPGGVHRLAAQFSDVGRARALAAAFRRAKPSKLDPQATGSFDARAFFDHDVRKWRVAVRYVPATAGTSVSSDPPEIPLSDALSPQGAAVNEDHRTRRGRHLLGVISRWLQTPFHRSGPSSS